MRSGCPLCLCVGRYSSKNSQAIPMREVLGTARNREYNGTGTVPGQRAEARARFCARERRLRASQARERRLCASRSSRGIISNKSAGRRLGSFRDAARFPTLALTCAKRGHRVQIAAMGQTKNGRRKALLDTTPNAAHAAALPMASIGRGPTVCRQHMKVMPARRLLVAGRARRQLVRKAATPYAAFSKRPHAL